MTNWTVIAKSESTCHTPPRHCEERSAVAIHAAVQSFGTPEQRIKPTGLPQAFGLRNDGVRGLKTVNICGREAPSCISAPSFSPPACGREAGGEGSDEAPGAKGRYKRCSAAGWRMRRDFKRVVTVSSPTQRQSYLLYMGSHKSPIIFMMLRCLCSPCRELCGFLSFLGFHKNRKGHAAHAGVRLDIHGTTWPSC